MTKEWNLDCELESKKAEKRDPIFLVVKETDFNEESYRIWFGIYNAVKIHRFFLS